MSRLSFLAAMVVVWSFPAHGQQTLPIPSEPVEWGEVSPEVLHVSDYPADSNASAVILSDYGKGRLHDDGNLRITYHTRVKILNEGGYDNGTVTIPFYAETQSIKDVEGVTYTVDGKGAIQEHELDDDDVFEEDIDGDYNQVRFTLPNLEPGAVIEYTYELETESWMYIPPWSFQHAQPTLYSEFSIRLPGFLDYVTLKTGSQNFDTVEEETKRSSGRRELQKRWVMKEVPALREEPFMTTPEDYRSRLRLQAKALRHPQGGYVMERFMSTWPDLAETLLDAEYFGSDLGEGGGGVFGGDGELETQVEQLTEGVRSDSVKMYSIYDYVRSSIEWNGKVRMGRDQDFDEILETKTANSAGINLLLVSMLQNAGIEAHPVLISTREHGKVYPLYPFVNQFNSTIAAVQLPNREDWMLLDATEPLCPPTMLPERDLNRQGWLVRVEEPAWIDITPLAQTGRHIYVEGTLQQNGTLTGKINVRDQGYHALDARKNLQSNDPSSFVRDHLLEGVPEVSLSDVSVENQEVVNKPLRTTATVEIPGYAHRAGPMLYANPRLMPSFTENPLKREERTFPVDFAHPRETSYTLSLQLPETFDVEEVPETQKIKLANDQGSFTRFVQASGNRLMVRSTLEINEPWIPPQDYQALRALFTKVVSVQSKQVVMKAAEPGAASSASSGDEQ